MAVILSLIVITVGCLYATAVRKKIGHSSTRKERLLWVLPALALFAAGPCIISVEEAAILQGLEGWSLGWLGGGKLVSIALKTSSIDVNGTGPQFLLQMALPILPIDRIKYPNAPAQTTISLLVKLLIAMAVHLLLFVPFTRDIASQAWKPHPVVEAIIVCGVLWSFLEMLFHSLNLLAASLGVPTKPCMRNPLISSSLRDFWAHRWNLPTSDTLRITCYDPLMSVLAPSTSSSGTTQENHKSKADGSSPVLSATQHASSDTMSQRRPLPISNTNGTTIPPPQEKQRSRSPRQKWAALAGLSLAFFLSGAVHHWLISLFTNTNLLSDCRFAILFFIQPPLITAQEACFRSAWWRSVKVQAPAAARLAQWATTVVLFTVPCWFLMRGPFLDNDGGRAFVLFAMRDLGCICTAALPAGVCTAATRLEPLLDAAFSREL